MVMDKYTEEELELLIKQYTPLVRYVINKKGLKTFDHMDDLMQNGTIGLWHGLVASKNMKIDNMLGFLFRCIYIEFINVYFKKKKTIESDSSVVSLQRLSSVDDFDNDKDITFASIHIEPVDISAHLICEKIIHDIQNIADKKLSDMVLRYYIKEQGWQEIATIHGCDRQNIKIRVDRFIKSYRKRLIFEHYFSPEELNMV